MKRRHRQKHTILTVLPLAYQDGRDRYVGLLQYIAKHRAKWNVHLVRENIPRRTLERELESGIDGIITNADMIGNSFVPLIPPDMPCVVTDPINPECFEASLKNVAFVDADSEEIGRLGANYLFGQGNYTSFGFIGLDEPFHWSQTRLQSFRQTLAEKGVECSVLNVRRNTMHEADTTSAMCEWAAALHRPAAVMAASDELARQFVEAIAAHGLSSPNDIAVLGVDNEWIFCTHMQPTLSSVQPDFERAGFLAAQCLDRMMRAGGGNIRMTCPVKTIVGRESTAPSNTAGLMIRRAEEFIHDHPSSVTCVGDVARHLKVSRRLLDLRFHAITGKTVLSAIQDEQLDRVRDLLRTTSLSITEISTLCNFRSENHLKSLFKKTFGITMRDYRKSAETGRTRTRSGACPHQLAVPNASRRTL